MCVNQGQLDQEVGSRVNTATRGEILTMIVEGLGDKEMVQGPIQLLGAWILASIVQGLGAT